MTLVHRNAKFVGDADYFSRCGTDMCFDEQYLQYLNFSKELRKLYPPVTGEMKPQNMPNYRAPCTPRPSPSSNACTVDDNIATLASDLDDPSLATALIAIVDSSLVTKPLAVVPILFGRSELADTPANYGASLHCSQVSVFASSVTSTQIAIYGFNSGHFVTSFQSSDTAFDLVLAADTNQAGRSLFKTHCKCPTVLDSSTSLLRHITSSKLKAPIHVYLMHVPGKLSPTALPQFWKLQVQIIKSLYSVRGLQVLAIVLPPLYDLTHVNSARTKLKSQGWSFTHSDIYFPDLGDSISSSCTVLLGVHESNSPSTKPLHLVLPPQQPCKPISDFVYQPFNIRDKCVCPAPSSKEFDASFIKVSVPVQEALNLSFQKDKRLYNLLRPTDDQLSSPGTGVFCVDHLCPPVSENNSNLFQRTFGIELIIAASKLGPDETIISERLVRPFSPFEHASAFRLDSNLTHDLSHAQNFALLEQGIPQLTSQCIFEAISKQTKILCEQSTEILDRSSDKGVDAPVSSRTRAKTQASLLPAFLNSAIGVTLPCKRTWAEAYQNDPECKLILSMISNLSLIIKDNLAKVHYIYRQPLRNSDIFLEDSILYLCERFCSDTKFVKL